MSQTASALVSTLVLPVTRTARVGRTAAAAVARPARTAARWPVESQQRSRRNAMLAATDLTDRRRQTLLVEEFLAGHAAAREARLAGHAAPLAAEG